MSQQELNTQRLREATADYQRFKGDTGSSEVQGASLITLSDRQLFQHLLMQQCVTEE